ncbi:orm1-like protein [Anaeramoeba ignava]|uniref:Orm1-like protein n=1 Tax=Anaeramoeba ignava TaxID=1746090 RepID=A0A9Q0LY31_ANAIG|nr:orm1-like protein [Anaeramoeba ignava]
MIKVGPEDSIPQRIEPLTNKSINWAGDKFFWIFYVWIIFGFRIFLWMIGIEDSAAAWTATNIVHSVVTFFAFHWIKGTPFSYDQGIYDKLTFWEQIDCEIQNTWTRKFLLIIPIVLLLITCNHTKQNTSLMMVNVFFASFVIIGKFPAMHRVRILGINK